MNATEIYIQRLLEAEPLRKPLLRSIIESLCLPPGSRGVDVGCGIGLQCLLLAEAAGSGGHVTGVDIDAGLLAYAEGLAREEGLPGRVTFRQGDAARLPLEGDSVDWAWSVDCAGYPAGDLLPQLVEMIRVVRPGGTVAVLAWSSQRLLPGYPMLEDRLNAHCSSYASFLGGTHPGQHFLRAPYWFRQAGLEDVQAVTFARDVRAPLQPGERAALISLFDMLWNSEEAECSPEDAAEYRRLCAPDSPDLILGLPDYYAFFTYTLFRGTVPASAG